MDIPFSPPWGRGGGRRGKRLFSRALRFSRSRGQRPRGDRLFFNFPFVCLSTLQIRATVTTSRAALPPPPSSLPLPRSRSLELSSVKSDRVARFFAFCFLISSRWRRESPITPSPPRETPDASLQRFVCQHGSCYYCCFM